MGFFHYPQRGFDAGQHGCKTTESESTDSPLPTLLSAMYCVRVSMKAVKISLCNTKEKWVVSNLSISLRSPHTSRAKGKFWGGPSSISVAASERWRK